MKFQVRNKGGRRAKRDIRDFVDKATIEAECDDDARALQKLFSIFMDVGTGGLHLILDSGLKDIRAAKERQV